MLIIPLVCYKFHIIQLQFDSNLVGRIHMSSRKKITFIALHFKIYIIKKNLIQHDAHCLKIMSNSAEVHNVCA